MAFFQNTFFSVSLMRQTMFQMFLPNDVLPDMIAENAHYDRPTKTLYLLHGFTGNAFDWANGSPVQEMALKYNLAIVMPSGDNSFYVDRKGTGQRYESFISRDLPEFVQNTFHLSGKRDDNFIAGLSMGGYGAIHSGLLNPEKYKKIAAYSSALIIHDIAKLKPGTDNGIANYEYYVSIFGSLDEIENSDHNPEYLVKALKAKGEEIPPIFMACGTQDYIRKTNREFAEFLKRENVDCVYCESEGQHDWKFWNEYLEPSIQWMLE